ncbi:MAG: nitroreductase family protein [Deltaproteobacteria bacterium]|nr:nitroreductase family protein [Deltaproteobacteria bacterium]
MLIRKIEDRCNRCMLCVKECVSSVWREIEGVPMVYAPEQCNLCGHCIAVCPKSAVEHKGLDSNQIRKIGKKLFDSDEYKELALSRRSIRQYKDASVPEDIIKNIIDLARYSPTASNSQNIAYMIITDRELLEKISSMLFGIGERVNGWMQTCWGRVIINLFQKTDFVKTLNKYKDSMDYYIAKTREGRDFILHHAPVLLLIHGPKNTMFSNDNCGIASTNIINYAHSLGLGTCYIGYLTMALRFSTTLRKWLKVPKGRRVFVSMVMGYPSYSFSFTVSRKRPAITWIQ